MSEEDEELEDDEPEEKGWVDEEPEEGREGKGDVPTLILTKTATVASGALSEPV